MSPARHRLATALTALLCALALAGCGGGKKTGNDKILHPSGAAGCGQIICNTTAPPTHGPKPTVSKPKVTTAPPVVHHTTKPTVRPTPTPKPFDIYINGDKSGKSLIDPPQAAVYAGTRVIFHNADTKPRGVKADNGAFNSGLLQPGASYTWVARVGNYPYSDLTRPYVTAALQVAPR
jgi:hypothetical protein